MKEGTWRGGGAGEGRKGPESREENRKARACVCGTCLQKARGKHLVALLFLWPGLPVSLVLLLRHLSLLGDAINIRRSLDHALKDCRRRGLAASCSSHRKYHAKP